jgi:hypothetical protein
MPVVFQMRTGPQTRRIGKVYPDIVSTILNALYPGRHRNNGQSPRRQPNLNTMP